ncbi:S-methyl-5-thioribose kinase [Proteiniclasticum sp. SCR006]|uniref:S-methyl-5-thioribose kinase n=1 Tax=Proteiniclasticum aestuarii TaxID=2817862 RepID=A0A939HBK0_9CLOT|nr:S-methyl-5-thioribose kinase [Proteiniclasticum aestuarii]MBO1265428.1 S-methyl-5-thioribose kinase [Proteiniclasticum aestuarii]
MNKYNKHFLLDTHTVIEYVLDQLEYFGSQEKVEAMEIGDGNINYVFKVWNPESGKSIIIKQADTLLRSSGRPLDMYRNRIEAEILKIQGELSPESVPEIYHYDEKMYILAMEDISVYKNLRTEMLDGKTFSHFSENITTFLTDTLIPTTDLFITRAEKKENVKKFMNPELCDISEDLVFTEPYWDYKKRNIILEENMNFAEEYLYKDKMLHLEVAKLRDRYMNYPQALIHGDLHSGSIFANEIGIKVIDPEFAFYGPIGYDSGNVIGNLCLSWLNKEFEETPDHEFIEWIRKAISDIILKLDEKITSKLNECRDDELYTNEFKKYYVDSIIEDTYGYAGTEIIRRVVGDSKVKEVSDVKNLSIRVPMERAMIKIGIHLIKNRYEKIDVDDLQRIIDSEK